MGEKSPAFRFYPMDFLSDQHVRLMDAAAVGAYVMLLCSAWIDGSIPSDPAALARLVRMNRKEFDAAWPQIAPCWRDADPGRLIQPRLESERVKQAEYSERQTRNGSRGGRPKKAGDNPNETHGKPTGFSGLTQTEPNQKPARARFSFSLSLSTYLASLDTARETDRSIPSRAVGFAEWFVSRGIEAKAIPPDRGLDVTLSASRESLEDAEALLTAYPPDGIEARLQRFFAAVASREIHRRASIAAFRSCWDWNVVAGENGRTVDPVADALGDELDARMAARS